MTPENESQRAFRQTVKDAELARRLIALTREGNAAAATALLEQAAGIDD